MGGSLTYNFDPGQMVYAIVDCESTRTTATGAQNTSGLMISNAQFPGTPEIQKYPATGNIIVRPGVIQELLSAIALDTQNSDARLNVEVTGGVVVSQGTQAQMTVEVDALGAVTNVAVLTGGSLYINGTGFTFLLATTAGGGDGLAEITYDVVGGAITNPTVSVPGSLYVGQASFTVDVAGGIVTAVTITNGGAGYSNGTGLTFLLTATAGGGDGLAQITYDVVGGAITNAVVSAGGTTYTNGAGQGMALSDIPVPNPLAITATDVPVPTGVTGFFGNGYFPDSTKAQILCDVAGGVLVDADIIAGGAQYADGTYPFFLTNSFGGGDGLGEITLTVVNGEVTNAVVSAGGTGYTGGANQTVDPLDIPAPVNSFLLTTTAGGGDGLAEISYTVVSGEIFQPAITNGGSTYTDNGSAVVTDSPSANEKDHELAYRIRFTDDRQTLLLEALVDSFGVEQESDIFATLAEAITEYETRLQA